MSRLLFQWRKAIAASDLPKSAKLLAHTLGMHMHPDGSGCRPGDKLIETESGLGKRTITRASALLLDTGWIVQLAGGRPGQGEKRLARVFFPRIPTSATMASVTDFRLTPKATGTSATVATQVVTTEVERDSQQGTRNCEHCEGVGYVEAEAVAGDRYPARVRPCPQCAPSVR